MQTLVLLVLKRFGRVRVQGRASGANGPRCGMRRARPASQASRIVLTAISGRGPRLGPFHAAIGQPVLALARASDPHPGAKAFRRSMPTRFATRPVPRPEAAARGGPLPRRRFEPGRRRLDRMAAADPLEAHAARR